MISYVCHGWPKTFSTPLQTYQKAQQELSLIDSLLVHGRRIIVPASQHQYIRNGINLIKEFTVPRKNTTFCLATRSPERFQRLYEQVQRMQRKQASTTQ
ncbi:hypothetical protein PoB_007417000 [Plakobranchus ocellatus]|uniref:Uncharacterized protein n=1 Tax=Plakobranchus ocellatus TaxID=259542 RepID=A0AAV4DU27_9GAST|nr:hypothetical protein PoB_007417000 [Plakobranchus ocellatus]